MSIQHDGHYYSSHCSYYDNDAVTVVNQMTNGSLSVTVMDTLSCSYAGRRVTYCLQFRTHECQSNVAMETIESKSFILCELANCYSQLQSALKLHALHW